MMNKLTFPLKKNNKNHFMNETIDIVKNFFFLILVCLLFQILIIFLFFFMGVTIVIIIKNIQFSLSFLYLN